MTQSEPAGAAGASGPNHQAAGFGQCRHRGSPGRAGRRHQVRWPSLERRAQIVLALIVCGQTTAKYRARSSAGMSRSAGQPPDRAAPERETRKRRRKPDSRQAREPACAQTPVHHRPSWTKGYPPERQIETFRRQSALDQVVFTTGGASVGEHDLVQRALASEGLDLSRSGTKGYPLERQIGDLAKARWTKSCSPDPGITGGDQDVGTPFARPAHTGGNVFNAIVRNADVGNSGALAVCQRREGKSV